MEVGVLLKIGAGNGFPALFLWESVFKKLVSGIGVRSLSRMLRYLAFC